MVSFNTPETKRQSKQWTLKGQPGPLKARVHSPRTKQMMLAIFDSMGLVYTNIIPRGQTVNSNYIIKALAGFLKQLKLERPHTAAGDRFLHWDNAHVHTAAVVRDWLAARSIQVLEQWTPPLLSWLGPCWLLLLPEDERDAGRSQPNPWQLQKHLGTAQQNDQQRRLLSPSSRG